jgi:ribosomal protein S18 acetylase RimI-like enzyme
MEYQFRQAGPEDIKEVTALYKNAIQHMIDGDIYQWDEIYPNEEVLTGDIMNREMYLLIGDEILLACIVINDNQDEAYGSAIWKYSEGRIAVIHRLCVNHEYQGIGIGRKTMQLAEGIIKNSGYSSIRLDAFSDNPFARKLYEKLGYTYVGIVRFRKGLFYLLEKCCQDIPDSEVGG